MHILLQILISLFAVTLIHECGHYMAAKLCGLHVSAVAIFYGTVLSVMLRGTKFTIGFIPMGGFTLIPGIYKLRRSRRIIIYAAGILLNLLTFIITLFYFDIQIVKAVGIFSLVLAIINLIPADPFDGKKIFS